MNEESDKTEGFKVTDKRRFNTEGEALRKEAEPEKENKQGESVAGEPETEAVRSKSLPPMDFGSFILSLAETALFHLGLIKIPGSDEPRKDIQAARQTIDLLALLEEKTRGNLTENEQKIMAETLFQLRMAFVQASK